ncbi:MAG: hypothetical protein JNL85_11755 [Rubrivivax sp.]|nr:hypothetical protein [Rubrivivax sp.]
MNALLHAEAVDLFPGTGRLLRAHLTEIDSEGWLIVQLADGSTMRCECVQLRGLIGGFRPKDRVLVLPPDEPGSTGVVVGRIARYTAPASADALALEAGEALKLKCGESSIDLRADGKVVINGDDVLVRAKGTKRIRAGSVSIN